MQRGASGNNSHDGFSPGPASCGSVEEDKDVFGAPAAAPLWVRGARARGDINDNPLTPTAPPLPTYHHTIGHRLTILFLGQEHQSVWLPACISSTGKQCKGVFVSY